MGKYEKKAKKWAAWLYYGALGILLLFFFVSAYFVIKYWAESAAAGNRYDELSAIVESVQQEQVQSQGIKEVPLPTQLQEADRAEPEMLPEYAALYEKNDHLVGWIRIDGTVIDYPVMQTPEEKNFYLRRDFDKKDNSHGCIYVNEACDVNKPSDNVTIYGHYMRDGSMFQDLGNYLNEDFRADHPYIQFDTLYERRTYEIFAVFKTSATLGKGFEYHNFINAASEEDFNWFVNQCKTLAEYDTGITPEYGDKIICLSTCEYTMENGRLVVAAVLIDE